MRHRGQLAATILLATSVAAAAGTLPALASAHHEGAEISTHRTTLGRVLSNPKGRVMYVFLGDGKKVSHCNGACASVWPHVTSKGKPRAADGVRAGHLSRTSKGQVTYYGRPLYFFATGKKPGTVSGEGLNRFYVVGPNGKPVKPKKKTTKPTGGPTGPAEVTTGTVETSTEVLTSSNGHTLYALSNPDERTTYWCSGGCLSVWIPLLTKGTPKAAGDAQSSLLGTVTRAGVGTQVTYNGYPLYDFKPDTAAGQDNGEGLFGPYYPTQLQYWYDLTPSGSFNL
jgi:predicted lipoprotein with Yx(FWY)xxD motif